MNIFNVWQTTSIEETPQIELADWRIYEVSSELWPEITRHFCGYNLTEMEGRVSSSIVEFDKDKLTGKTRSGRVYKLSDEKIRLSQSGDAAYVWSFFVERNKLSNIKDVTKEYKESI
jgi:hypothetical protein